MKSKSLMKFYCNLLLTLGVLILAACSGGDQVKLAVGDLSPDFLIEDLGGRSIRLADLNNHPVVLRFFVTDCKYCRADTGVFNDYYRKHHSQGLEVLYITTTVDREQVKKFVEELQVPFPVAIDYNRQVSQVYNIKIEPQTIVLDPSHRIMGAILGGVTEKELDEMLGRFWTGSSPSVAGRGVETAPAPAPANTLDQLPPDARCPVCGMFVAKYDVWVTRLEIGPGIYRDFDGVKDLMAYCFDPLAYGGKAKEKEGKIWVKDYYSLKWLDGHQASYVVGSDVHGPMGHELIPFSTRAGAESFLADHHGKQILSFAEITPELVEELRGTDRMKDGGE
jgi:copper chaperone NosL